MDLVDPKRRQLALSLAWSVCAMGSSKSASGQTPKTKPHPESADPALVLLTDPKTKRRLKLRARLPEGSGKAGLII